MWAVYWHSWLVMREVLLDKVMYVEFLPLQPPAPLHKAVLRGCSADLWPQQETALPFMSLRTASIYQASAGSFDLQQHVTWSYLSEVDFGFIVANTACVNLHVWVSFFFTGQRYLSFSSGSGPPQFMRVPSLVQKWAERFDLQCEQQLYFQTKGII